MSVKIGLAALAAALVGMGSCQLAAAKDTPARKYDAKQCFYSRNVESFAAPDQHNLYIRVGVRDVYHFEMFGPCPDIDWNQRLALVARPGPWICDGMDAEVVTHAVGLGPQRCLVRNMHKLTPDEVAALPKRARP
jgi:hypothetical protein